MAMVSVSEQRVLEHHHPYEGRSPLSSHPPLVRHHQLKPSIRGVLQDVYNCKLISRRPVVESFCQVVLRDVNQSSSSYEKVSSRTNILYNTADALWDVCGQSVIEQSRSHARIAASLDSDAGKAEGARKALEQAFQGKDNLAKKWEEEIRKRELSGGDGSSGSGGGRGGGGGSWGGGGGGGDEEMGEDFGSNEPWDWEEAGQTFMATFALLILYISITHGPKQVLKKFKLLFRYIRQGFRLRKIPEEYLTAEGSGIPSDDEEVDDDEVDDEDDEGAAAEFLRGRRAEVSASANGARDADIQKNGADDYDETEDDEEMDMPTLPKQQREDLLSKRQAEHKEKLYQMLTPKELRQQQQEEKKSS